jgi:hypothetical protein
VHRDSQSRLALRNSSRRTYSHGGFKTQTWKPCCHEAPFRKWCIRTPYAHLLGVSKPISPLKLRPVLWNRPWPETQTQTQTQISGCCRFSMPSMERKRPRKVRRNSILGRRGPVGLKRRSETHEANASVHAEKMGAFDPPFFRTIRAVKTQGQFFPRTRRHGRPVTSCSTPNGQGRAGPGGPPVCRRLWGRESLAAGSISDGRCRCRCLARTRPT